MTPLLVIAESALMVEAVFMRRHFIAPRAVVSIAGSVFGWMMAIHDYVAYSVREIAALGMPPVALHRLQHGPRAGSIAT